MSLGGWGNICLLHVLSLASYCSRVRNECSARIERASTASQELVAVQRLLAFPWVYELGAAVYHQSSHPSSPPPTCRWRTNGRPRQLFRLDLRKTLVVKQSNILLSADQLVSVRSRIPPLSGAQAIYISIETWKPVPVAPIIPRLVLRCCS